MKTDTVDREKAEEVTNISHFDAYSQYKVIDEGWEETFPEHWEERPLQFWVKKITEKGAEDRELPFITLEHIESSTGKIVDGFEWEKKESDEYYTFEEGDVLFGKLRPYLRKYLRVNRKGCCGTDLMVLRPRTTVLDEKFFYYFLQSEYFMTHAEANSYGVKMPRTSWNKLSSYNFCLPDPEEQKAIVHFLDQETEKIDRLIEQKERLIELLEEKREALITRAVTKGLDPDAEMKDSGVEWLGDIPVSWEVTKLRFLAKITTGDKDTIDQTEEGEYPFFVRSPDVKNIDTYSHDCEAVLTAGDGVGVGEVFHHIDGKFECHQRVYKIYDFSEVDGKYFYYFLKSNLQREIFKHNAKSTVDSLRMPMFKNFPVAFPSKEEQEKIVSYLDKFTDQIDSFLEKIEDSIETLKEYRKSLISHAVTGKIDVREEVDAY